MPNLTVNNNTYAYPDPGTEQGQWGEEATGWAEDVTAALDSLAGTGTINETQVLIEQTKVTPAEISGLVLNNSIVESAQITYRIYRQTNSAQLSETGLLNIVYNPSGGSGEKWLMSQTITAGGNSKVSVSIDDNGQVFYTSEDPGGTGYTGYIKFKTITILKT